MGQLYPTAKFLTLEKYKLDRRITALDSFAYFRLRHTVSVQWPSFPDEPGEFAPLTHMIKTCGLRG